MPTKIFREELVRPKLGKPDPKTTWGIVNNPGVKVPTEGMMMRRTDQGHAVVWLHAVADPVCRSTDWYESQRKRFSSQALFDQEVNINYDALSGSLVYPEFDPKVHVVPDSAVPGEGCLFMAIDPHPRTPHAFLWVLIDGFSDWWIYRELWPSKVSGIPKTLKDEDEENIFTVRDYCETIARMEGNDIEWYHAETDREYGVYRERGGERIIFRFMDQAGKAFLASGEAQAKETLAARYRRFGIMCSDPRKDIQAGQDAIHELLKPRWDSRTESYVPRLRIAASCEETILEFTKLRFRKSPRDLQQRELTQDPVAARSHLIDLVRYLATSPGKVQYYRSSVSRRNLKGV